MEPRKLTMPELNRLNTEEFRSAEKFPVVVVLDNIRSQNNTGSAFRTCDAFRVEKLYLCGITATPPHREIHKTALGAEESVKWKYYPATSEAIMELKAAGYMVLALEHTTSSLMLQDFVIPEESKIALVFGNEVEGINDESLKLADACLEIPQFGTKHSINVSVAVGVTLWEILKKLRKI
ncbi:MAG: RNA methyltransferase [Bacteroidota bacterium]|jgi:23S rRNA (guanosine2251-2'-O)-methyltransferase